MEKFIKTKSTEKTWYKTTYLLVKCTSAEGMQQLHYYRNKGKGGLHAEEIFLRDVKASIFPANSKFKMYMNWTPCVKNVKCCDQLLSAFKGTGLRIYAVALNRVTTDTDKSDTVEKFKLLKDNQIRIKSLDRKKFLSLFSDHRETLEPKLKSYEEFIDVRDVETKSLLDKI